VFTLLRATARLSEVVERLLVCGAGVTQQLIDDTRLAPENIMLADMQNILNVGGDFQQRGTHGETAVCPHTNLVVLQRGQSS